MECLTYTKTGEKLYLLSMACEMLLNSDNENRSFMLIEEPEAHIHAQRQLKMMQSLQGGKKNQQIIMTTHSLDVNIGG